jgi:hypothetical protein
MAELHLCGEFLLGNVCVDVPLKRLLSLVIFGALVAWRLFGRLGKLLTTQFVFVNCLF